MSSNEEDDEVIDWGFDNSDYLEEEEEEIGMQRVRLPNHLFVHATGTDGRYLDYISSNTRAKLTIGRDSNTDDFGRDRASSGSRRRQRNDQSLGNGDYTTGSGAAPTARSLVIRGTGAERRLASKLLRKIVERFQAKCHTDYVFIPASIYDALTGDNGTKRVENTLKYCQRESNTSIRIPKDHSNPCLYIAQVTGLQSDTKHACQLLNEATERLLNEHGTDVLFVSRYTTPLLIGRHGINIQKIRSISGASCTIEELPNSDRKAAVSISGTGRQRQIARYLILNCIKKMIRNGSLVGPEECHMIFAHPFQHGELIALKRIEEKGLFLLDTVASNYQGGDDKKEDDNVEASGRSELAKSALDIKDKWSDKLSCISYNWAQPSMRLNIRSYEEIIGSLMGMVTDFLAHIASNNFSTLKLSVSFGKQSFTFRDEPPAQISLATAYRASNVEFFSKFFNNTRFLDKIGSVKANFGEMVKEHLLDQGFIQQHRRSSIPSGDSGSGVSSNGSPSSSPMAGGDALSMNSDTDSSLKIYWKDLRSKQRVITKMQILNNGEPRLVRCINQPFKPLVITFMHPPQYADFRIRLVVNTHLDNDKIAHNLRQVLDSLRIRTRVETNVEIADEEDEQEGSAPLPAESIDLHYPRNLDLVHSCIRSKSKNRFFKNGYKVLVSSIHQVNAPNDYTSSTDNDRRSGAKEWNGVPSYGPGESNIDSSRMMNIRSNEISLKSPRLNQLLASFNEERQVLSGGNSAPLLDKEKKLKSGIVHELIDLIMFGDRLAQSIPWEFCE